MNIHFKLFVFLITWYTCLDSARAQDASYIYADVVLKNKTTVTGVIRWSSGQIFWTDVLQVSKTDVLALKYLKKYQLDKLPGSRDNTDGINWEFMNLWTDKLPKRRQETLCRFGDIVSIHVTGSQNAQIFFKSGSKIRVSGGSEISDLGKDILVYSSKAQKIAWKDISRINFRETGESTLPWKGKPLYGTVQTVNGPVSGLIKWDKSKFASSAAVYGKRSDRTVGINFSQIKKISKKDQGAVITLLSGKQVFLKDSRDVNASNRGIVIADPEGGQVIVQWSAFQSADFHQREAEAINYNSFARPRRIYAQAFGSEGRILKGNCTFDMDEEWNFEMLEGTRNRIHYKIPFSNISGITPQNEKQSNVILKDQRSLTLNNENDVSALNWGLIIWLKNSKYQYLPWEEINKVQFR
ncbi:hypothetical protein B0I27_101155 [Arcticibacter pallidicorallinus]|uniref:Uncharacterized protein n=1 Tax=Arcticibacter pallidicorallinus TaxID=1259464 RepID=A0A2T0UBJ8_9SPHI|nr:hypothetical protein [Arcticibacter pallidicorallinus]PRY55187.1 hypothetical protein B0I27_101155 [Arcticibacter pallidicorallinus]